VPRSAANIWSQGVDWTLPKATVRSTAGGRSQDALGGDLMATTTPRRWARSASPGRWQLQGPPTATAAGSGTAAAVRVDQPRLAAVGAGQPPGDVQAKPKPPTARAGGFTTCGAAPAGAADPQPAVRCEIRRLSWRALHFSCSRERHSSRSVTGCAVLRGGGGASGSKLSSQARTMARIWSSEAAAASVRVSSSAWICVIRARSPLGEPLSTQARSTSTPLGSLLCDMSPVW
jgi:hypothetical protein